MGISLPRVTLVSIFVESILYGRPLRYMTISIPLWSLFIIPGLFLSLYAISTVILLRGRKRVKLNTIMLFVSFAMLLFATIVRLHYLQHLIEINKAYLVSMSEVTLRGCWMPSSIQTSQLSNTSLASMDRFTRWRAQHIPRRQSLVTDFW